MDIYKEVNKQKGANINGSGNNNDLKYRSRTGVVIPNRVFVGGICPTATETDLLNLFGKYGSVKGIKIVIDQNGSSKGYGFVTFDKADDALRLKNDANNVIFNERRLNIAPAVMKNPPLLNRYTDSYVVPVTPNLYFTNNLPYQYQEGTSVYSNSPYVPPVTIVPTLTDAAYYHQNNYAVPAAPYQGAALFYPLPTNTPAVMVGHQSYQQTQTNNSNYTHSLPAPTTSSPMNSNIKIANPMTTIAGSSEMHPSLSTAIIPAPPNVSSLPPPLSYHMAHTSQFYNSIMPPYTGEVYYNMINSACYPMVTVTGNETYIPYYELSESYNSNITEEPSCEPANNYHPINVPLSNVSEVNSCDSSAASTTNSNDCKTTLSARPPPNTDYIQDNSYSPENVPPVTATPLSFEAPIIQSQNSSSEFNSSTYVQHRGNTLIYPNTQIHPENVYFNSMYLADTANGSINQCHYSKSLSEHFVSDHLPKRDAKYPPKKYVPPPVKDIPPNIPKFPFYMNNNHPGFVNRNMKEKDFKNMNGKNIDVKHSQRPVRNLPNGNNMLAKPRIFHNQNQYGNPGLKNDRNGHVIQPNGQYLRQNSGRTYRTPYDQTVPTNSCCYENNNPTYVKNTNYDGYKKSGPNNGPYRSRYQKLSGTANETIFRRNIGERPKMYSTQELPNPSNEDPISLEQKTLSTAENLENQELHICEGVQTITLLN